MQGHWPVLRMALRAVVWKPTPGPYPVGLGKVLFWSAICIAAVLADQYVVAGPAAHFTPYGLNALIAWTASWVTLAAFLVRPENRTAFLCGILALSALTCVAEAAFELIPLGAVASNLWTRTEERTAVFLAYLVWGFGADMAILQSTQPARFLRRLGQAFALWATVILTWYALPNIPSFQGAHFDPRSSNLWEYIPAVFRADQPTQPAKSRLNRARIELAQPALLDEAVARIAPQTKDKTDIYTLGLAGWSDQTVFVSELDGALSAMSRTLPIDGRMLRLVNSVDSVATTPIASRQNFAAAVRAIGRIMNKQQDILLLFMTSHGFELGVALQLTETVRAWLAPEDVAAVLDREGIKNRIVIVSACYSGVFVKPLANDDTIVLTAADEHSPSFGCSNERKWTYFGDAFFGHSLHSGVKLQDAFANAKALIHKWENRDGIPASNPQGYFGRALTEKLAPLYRDARPFDRRDSANDRHVTLGSANAQP